MNSWPRDIRNFFHKPEIGVIDTFNFILFSFRNNVFLCLHLNSFSIKYRRNPVKILKRIPQSGSLISSLTKNIYGITSVFSIKISPFRWLPNPLKPLEHISISHSLPLFSLFQKLVTITKDTKEIFEANAN